ncbi:MAG: hypothetical protein M1812_007055 [Candelaria pacifica]|nr:MAG: hypothetical protein M1812_007055 [Candelaria pacifica]
MKSTSYDRLQEPSNEPAYPASSYTETISLKDFDDQRRTLVPSPFAPSIASQFGRPPPPTKQKANRWCNWDLVQNWWLWEIISLVTSVCATSGIVGVLVYFDGHPLPSWPYSITLNALISVLATISKAALLLPISEALSQLKWLWFRAGRKPLSDFDKFEQASRGPWGSARLFLHLRARHFASLGALVTILALAIDPFVQQTIGYRSETVLHQGSTPESRSYPIAYRAESYDDRGPGMKSAGNSVEGSMLSAIYKGIFAGSFNETQRPAQVTTESCTSGNCTFPRFSSMGVCSSCTNITSLVKKNIGTQEFCESDGCKTYNQCNDSLPNNIALRNTENDDGYSNISTLQFLPLSSKSLIYQHIKAPLGVFEFLKSDVESTTFDGYKPWAMECALYFCVQIYNTTVKSGKVSETIIGTWSNDSAGDTPLLSPSANIFGNRIIGGSNASQTESAYEKDQTSPNNITVTNDEFTASENATTRIQAKLYELFDESAVSRVLSGAEVGRLDFSSDMVQNFYFADNIVSVVENLASSMTSQIRLQADKSKWVYGRSTDVQIVVHVRWAWLTLQLLTIVLAMIFVLTAALKGKPATLGNWKSNALASLFHGLDSETQELLNRGRTNGEMHQSANGVSVRLASGNDGVKLSAMK